MQIETAVYNKLELEKLAVKSKYIKELVQVLKQATRFSHMDETALMELALEAWDGKLDLNKEPV